MAASLAANPLTLPTALLPKVLSFVPRHTLLSLALHRVLPRNHPFLQPSTLLLRRLLLAVLAGCVTYAKEEQDYRNLCTLLLMWDVAVGMEEDQLEDKCVAATRQLLLLEWRDDDGETPKKEGSKKKRMRRECFALLREILPTDNHPAAARLASAEESMHTELLLLVGELDELGEEEEEGEEGRWEGSEAGGDWWPNLLACDGCGEYHFIAEFPTDAFKKQMRSWASKMEKEAYKLALWEE